MYKVKEVEAATGSGRVEVDMAVEVNLVASGGAQELHLAEAQG